MLTLSHFTTVLLFATLASVVFAITQRSTLRGMVRYGAYCWVLFIASVVAASWLMYFIRR
ncbi:MAG: hypothetical protein WCA44_16885 [Acidobacteriaceae bacterium]